MKRSTAAALFAILLLAVILRLLPLLRHLYWGSDFGEYFGLTRALVQDGVLRTAYGGWGVTYPSFPGFFVVNGAFVVAGVPADAVVVFLVPVLAAFGVLPMFLIAVRVTGDEGAGLAAAAFLGVAFPHVFPTSHGIPASLGDFLLLGALLLFLGMRRSPKFFAPLVLAGLATVVTHHLATYVLLLAAASALLLRILLDRNLRMGDVRLEFSFLVALVGATLAFWSAYAVPFWTFIATTPPSSPTLVLLAGIGVVASVPAALLLRRRTTWRFRPRLHSVRGAAVATGLAFATTIGIAAAISLAPVPGTAIQVRLPSLLPLVPLFGLLAVSAGGRKVMDFAREGPDVTAWFLALVLSIVLGALLIPEVLIPYRHLEYLAIPLAVMIGAGLRWLTLGADRGKAAAAVGASVLLVAGSAATAYPPPATLAGFNEGIAAKTVEAALWVRTHADGLVAGDHRESTVLFGIGGVDATWDRELRFWHTADVPLALGAMRDVRLNDRMANVTWVMIDADLRAGLQATPFDPALPLLPAEEAKFTTAPFHRLFDSGFAKVYFVNWGLAP